MDILTNHNEDSHSNVQPNKCRRKKSIVWEHFTIETVNADCIRARCKHCKKSFAYITGSKLAGTSHLKRHISLGICPVNRRNQEKNQPSICSPDSKADISGNGSNQPRKRYRATHGMTRISFDQNLCHREIAKMIIQHDYPLHMVEHSGFTEFARCLHPHFSTMNISTVQDHVLSIYVSEKQRLLNLLNEIPGRVNLTLELWTSDQSLSYLFLRGHFIGWDWKLHWRIFNVVLIPFPDSETMFADAIAACLSNWGLESKLFTLTLDQSHATENTGNLRGFLSIRNSHILNGQLVLNSCYARALSRLAQDALEFMRGTVEKIRDSVKYVKASEAREEKFINLKQQLQVPSTKNLIIDELTKWNTTYHMLIAASELKEVFSCLDTSDPDYKRTPSMDEWTQVETLCTYLKLLYDAAIILTVPVYPTANTFFHDVWRIQHELMHAATSQDPFVSGLTKPLHERFTRYWEECNLVLAVAVVMDPRFKMKLVNFSFSRIYGADAETWIKVIDEGVHELYLEYVVQCLPPPTFIQEGTETVVKTEMTSQEDGLLPNGEGFSDFDIYISEIMNGQQMKSELDQYLEESLLPRIQDFDVLGWWRVNRSKYPTLSKMASDVLSIPVSTVSPNSVFDTRPRKMDSYRSLLRPSVLESLVCAKDWLQYEHSETPFGVAAEIPIVIPAEIPTSIVKTEF